MKTYTFILILITATQLSACNTFKGIGKDVQKGGQAIEKSANQTIIKKNIIFMLCTHSPLHNYSDRKKVLIQLKGIMAFLTNTIFIKLKRNCGGAVDGKLAD